MKTKLGHTACKDIITELDGVRYNADKYSCFV